MEIMSSLLLIFFASAIVVYALLTEGLDWIGRAEIIEKRWPFLWAVMNKRPTRLVLLATAVVMLAHVMGEIRVGAEVPAVKLVPPKVPEINPNVKIITLESRPPHRCWLSNYVGMPNSTIKGAVTASAAILHCNYKIESPFKVIVEFDRDFLLGGLILPDGGIMTGVSQMKQDKIYIGQVRSPPLLSDELVVITVYGATDQYPKPLRASISALK